MVKKKTVSGLSSNSVPSQDQKFSNLTDNQSDQAYYQSNLFLRLALDMTWQMALVVIIPIVGGYLLDRHYKTSPWLTLIGFIIAAVGVFGVLRRIVSQAGQRSIYPKSGLKK